MKTGVDSAYAPTAQSIAAAASGGVACWAGYFAGPNILNGWSLDDFHRVQAAGLGTFAYCSGFADPVAMKSQSLTWGVPICLDVEGGIRGDGSWVQGWLDASGAGLYGNLGVHSHTAPFHILAAYPGSDPHLTWPAGVPKPPTPCGWQWQGTHQAYGHAVDSSWLDDEMFGLFGDNGGIDDMFSDDDRKFLSDIRYAQAAALGSDATGVATGTHPGAVPVTMQSLQAQIQKIQSPPPATVDLKPVLDAIAALKVDVDAIKAKTDADLK